VTDPTTNPDRERADGCLQIADRLIEAFNARDVDGVLALVAEDVEFELGHRTLRGPQQVRELVERQLYGSGYRIAHGRRFCRGEQLVTESRHELRHVATDEVASVEHLAALYVTRNGLLTRYAEFPDLASAIAASSVTESDETSACSHK
jgi:ketosteroid isomerase-like protein